MSEEKRCIAEVWDRFRDLKCNKVAGYGPNGNYCKTHARAEGHKIGERITLYRVCGGNYTRPLRLAQTDAEETQKLFILDGRELDFDYSRRITKTKAGSLGIFTDKHKSIQWYLESKRNKVESAKKLLQQSEMELNEAEVFLKEHEGC
jgi:hypothetical protein